MQRCGDGVCRGVLALVGHCLALSLTHHFNLVIYYGIMSQPWCALQDRIGLQHLQRPLRRQLVGKVRAICYCNYRAVTPAGAPRHTSLDELQPPKPIWRPTPPPHQIALDCLGSAIACMCVHVQFRRPSARSTEGTHTTGAVCVLGADHVIVSRNCHTPYISACARSLAAPPACRL